MDLNKPIALTLGKLLVALAWADGELVDKEIQIVKDIIFRIPDLTDEEWSSIEMYIEPPVADDDIRMLMDHLKSLVTTDDEKKYVIEAMQSVIYADGKVTTEEASIFEELSNEIQAEVTGYESKLERLFDSAKKRRKKAVESIPEEKLGDISLSEQPIFHRVFSSMERKGMTEQMGKTQQEFICSAGALMASVAQADGKVKDVEISVIKDILKKYWNISDDIATVIAEIGINDEIAGMDILRICRSFFSSTTKEQRLNFIKALVEVIEADSDVDMNEQDRLRAIATHLKIPYGKTIELMPDVGPAND